MDWLASRPIYKEFIERTLFLPANKEVIAQGLDYKTDDAQVKAALNAFVMASATTDPQAYQMQGVEVELRHYGAWVSRLGQAMAGEMSIDEAFKASTRISPRRSRKPSGK